MRFSKTFIYYPNWNTCAKWKFISISLSLNFPYLNYSNKWLEIVKFSFLVIFKDLIPRIYCVSNKSFLWNWVDNQILTYDSKLTSFPMSIILSTYKIRIPLCLLTSAWKTDLHFDQILNFLIKKLAHECDACFNP